MKLRKVQSGFSGNVEQCCKTNSNVDTLANHSKNNTRNLSDLILKQLEVLDVQRGEKRVRPSHDCCGFSSYWSRKRHEFVVEQNQSKRDLN